MNMGLTFDEMCVGLASAFGKPVTTTVAAGVYEHRFGNGHALGTLSELCGARLVSPDQPGAEKEEAQP